MSSFFARRRAPWLAVVLLSCVCVAAVATATARTKPVSFSFEPPPSRTDPFAREIWAEVITPSNQTLRLPAFYAGNGEYAVRARADEIGEYRLGQITASEEGKIVALETKKVHEEKQRVSEKEERSAVKIGAGAPARFEFTDGRRYMPIGANLAWATKPDRVGWYENAFKQFSKAGLNWTRVWMAHWGGLNLDWRAPSAGKSPAPGMLDLQVAADWDKIVSAAEQRGVYVQMILQHHGQVSSKVNPNWNENPWNAANPGGFLRTPGEFFTSERAQRLTKQKYRYAVARWGYSPAVLAWELFNEVHWVDALRIDHNEAAVAHWHDEMAAYVRSIDVYRHLVTTSTEDLGSPIYKSLDYFQPHLYATGMLAAARRFDVPPEQLDRPVFYGEMGDDNMRLTPQQKAAGVELVPIVWASLMGEGRFPVQIWEGDKILAQKRIGELGAVARFMAASDLANRDGLHAFSAAIEGRPRVPLVIEGAENWHRRPPGEFEVPNDGRQPLEFGTIPRIIVGSPKSIADGYPDRTTFHVDYPAIATAHIRLADAGAAGAVARVQVDGQVVADHTWDAIDKNETGESKPRPVELAFAVAKGAHTIALDNPGKRDWFDFEALDLGLETSVLASIGRRSADFIMLWVWHHDGVFALTPTAAASGKIVIEDVPAGTWRITWWDTIKGIPAAPVVVEHPGGTLQLPTPAILRHAAVVLTR